MRSCWCSPFAFVAPPFTGLDTLPSLGVVLISLGVLLDDALLALIGLVVGAVGAVCWSCFSAALAVKRGEQPLLAERGLEYQQIHRLAAVGRGRPSDAFGGDVRRRDSSRSSSSTCSVREPAYGNRLIEEIERITQGAISVNPNTMYPLLKRLEGGGLVDASWERPDRRTRRYYSITPAGRREYRRLKGEVEPFLDSVIRSVSLIKGEVYGDSRVPRGGAEGQPV